MSIVNNSQIPEDLNSLKRKLNKLMSAIDEVSLIENNTHAENSIDSPESHCKYLESLHSAISDRLMNLKLNMRESVLKSLETFEATIDQTLLSGIFKEDYDPKRLLRKNTDINESLLMEKRFKLRESTITELINSREEFQTLKNMALALMSLFFINLMLQDYFEHGYFFNIQILIWCFSGGDIVITTWVLMFFYSFLIILLVKTIVSLNLQAKIWIPLYIIFQCLLTFFAVTITRIFDLSFGSSMILMCEAFRLQMKMHSYLRTKLLYGWGVNEYKEFIPSFLKKKLGFSNLENNLPEIKIEDYGSEVQRFSYFLFAPTLLYRDQYLLRSKSDIKFIIDNLIEFFFGIYYTFILFRIYLQPNLIVIGKENSWNSVVFISIFQTVLPSFLCLFILFYIVVHSWQNLWAELLRFPDRKFYEDWWNSMNMREWIRKFVTLNHEWLYTYIYIDFLRFTKERFSRKSSKILTFIFSCSIHLCVISSSLGFMGFEEFFIFSCLTYALTSKGSTNKHAMNILFWIEISLGISFMMTMYSRDYYRNYTK